MAYIKTGRPVGRPSKEVLRSIKEDPVYGPPVPKGLNWGGRRKGSGRKRIGPQFRKKRKKLGFFEITPELQKKLAGIHPRTKKAPYYRKAVEFMLEVAPPEGFGKLHDPNQPRDESGQYSSPMLKKEKLSEMPGGGGVEPFNPHPPSIPLP